ncbi:MAG TPA: LysR family transcriptional regulator [Tepidisphaeraceae bacterium]|nr:LysR family transcriptional regulator [Tepidisphaeraceae bacterium]
MKDVHQLQVFAAVAENLSFTRAAEALFLTQSAVSHQIAGLEEALGAELFVRQPRGVALTPAGQVLLDRSRRIFAAFEEARIAVRTAARPDQGTLRIGASASACQFIIPEALREFRESFPGYAMSITPGDSPVVSERLAEGAIDLGLMIRPQQRTKLTFHPLFADQLGFVVSPLHPWAKAGRVDRKALGEQRLVLYSHVSATFRLVERYFVRAGVSLKDYTELGSMEAIKELVKIGLGVSVMARWVVAQQVADRTLVWLPAPGGQMRREWVIAMAAGRRPSLAEQTFIGLCQAVAAGLGEA